MVDKKYPVSARQECILGVKHKVEMDWSAGALNAAGNIAALIIVNFLNT